MTSLPIIQLTFVTIISLRTFDMISWQKNSSHIYGCSNTISNAYKKGDELEFLNIISVPEEKKLLYQTPVCADKNDF